MNDIEEIIEEFNDGNWQAISKIFNNKIEVFLSFILQIVTGFIAHYSALMYNIHTLGCIAI